MPFDEALADRVRRLLSSRTGVVERKMMGGVCFMIDGNMCCGVSGGSVMVRVGQEAYTRLLAEPHVRPLEFAGRRPKGFVVVDPEGWSAAADLPAWIGRGIDVAAALPAKPPPAAGSLRRRRG
jgi:TfoX/Sxy family transcriptional regulator of competence genes